MSLSLKKKNASGILTAARDVFSIEARSLTEVRQRLDHGFAGAVLALLSTRGRVVVTGMGKSGLIGKKISATLSSTGTPSHFVHPGEANHGDLGMIAPKDVVLAISYSGETEEVIRLLPYLKEKKIALISMTGNPASTLATQSEFHLNISVRKEACPHQLAPTSSTTAALVMGDALAVALMKQRGFLPEDFAQFHPGGSLGKRLLTKVEQVMVSHHLPVVSPSTPLSRVITTMSSGRLGVALVCEGKRLKGIISDGDLRRAVEKHKVRLFQLTAGAIMTKNPKTVGPKERVTNAEALCNKHKITSLVVTEKGHLKGIFQIYTLAKI